MRGLCWALKESLIDYMRRDPEFSADVSGGALFDDAGSVFLPASRGSDGAIRATGAAVLRAHHGTLNLPLIDLVIVDNELWVTLPALIGTEGDGERLRLATLVTTENPDVFDVKLASDADAHFLYNYVPGVAFGRLRVLAAE